MYTHPIKFTADTSEKIVTEEKKSEIMENLKKYKQHKILKILEEKNKETNSKIFSELLEFNFPLFHSCFESFKLKQNIISDVSEIKSIPENATIKKNNFSSEKIEELSEIGLKLISDGSGSIKSRSYYFSSWRCQQTRLFMS